MVILDLGVGHKGQVAKALSMVGLAHKRGLTAVKLQCYAPDLWAGGRVPAHVPRSLSAREVGEVMAYANSLGIPIGLTLFTHTDMHGAVWPLEGVAYLKLACDDYRYSRLLYRANRLSVGLKGLQCTCGQVHKLMASATNPLDPGMKYVKGARLLCVPCYPCPPMDVPLQILRRSPIRTMGYSDHTGCAEVVRTAMASTDCAIEIHHESEGPWGYEWHTITGLAAYRKRLAAMATEGRYKAVGRDVKTLQRAAS